MTKTGKILTAIGLLLLAAALCLTVYNLRSDTAARRSADAVLAQLTPELEERVAAAEADTSAPGEAPAAAEPAVPHRRETGNRLPTLPAVPLPR